MRTWILVAVSVLLSACASSADHKSRGNPTAPFKYLALGDSYTIGQSVDLSERWPAQLVARLKTVGFRDIEIVYRARTGWTTGDLLAELERNAPTETFDMVSLLIGVNNQYRRIDIDVYKRDVQALISKAAAFAGGEKDRLFVVSIPDYAYTPFGSRGGDEATRRISMEIDEYNEWMRDFCREKQIPFIDITWITRNGLENPSLVASDGLHPSGAAYALFAEEILESVDVQVDGVSSVRRGRDLPRGRHYLLQITVVNLEPFAFNFFRIGLFKPKGTFLF